MDRREGAQTPFEVYCYRCRVSFALGTRTCVHCGAPIGRNRMGAGPGPVQPGEPAAEGVPLELADEGELQEVSIGRRLGGTSLWILLAIGAALARMCGG
jgi:hypothetical protein